MMLPFPIHWHIVACLSDSFRTGRGAGLSQAETSYSTLTNEGYVSLSKTLTFCDTTPGFLMKWHLHFWESSAEIPYWWHVTFQIWIVLLIGWSKFPKWHDQSGATNQKHYPDLGSVVSSVWNFCARFSDVISWGNQWWHHEILPVLSC